MREANHFTFSLFHLPTEEREAIEQMIRTSSRNEEGRLEVRYPDLVIEPHLDGFFVHASVAGWASAERPEAISPAFWAILAFAAEAGASWVSFDREVPASEDWPSFP
ncbi:hypothetical protein FHW96_004613 [Novosphingobium sp. SG751A]|uniref:DUF5983 family protein n=1 Tax=Novosphingobium sp. SG751A TaxID=2587000 RepID=UPI001555A7F5|nr:hypothetical protein [Novosphingobium sp. SG751A]NOW48425.1 hypothetical protein [Novosphingobium sp. SG751A]